MEYIWCVCSHWLCCCISVIIVSYSRAKLDSVAVCGVIDPAKESLENILNALEDGK